MTISANRPLGASPALSVPVQGDTLKTFATSSGFVSRIWRWLRSLQVARSSERRLRVADTVSLGEKRFVAVVQVDGRHFLLAGGPANIALLAQLDEKDDFAEVLEKTMTVAPSPEPSQEEAKSIRKRAPRARKAPAPVAPVWKKPANASQKATSAGVKKQPPLAAKRAARPSTPTGRFGDIPPAANGARAFERWLGRTIPVATTPAASVSIDGQAAGETVAEQAGAASPLPLTTRASISDRMQEVRPLAELPLVPIKATTVEEYA